MTDLRLEVQPEQIECEPAGRTTLDLALRNVSDVVEHYEALVLGLPDGITATVEPAVAKLRPGERASLAVTLTVDGAPHAGEYVLGVLVRSSAGDTPGRGASRCEEVRLRVPRHDEVVVGVDPPQLAGGALATFRTRLENRGNAPVRLKLTGRDDTGKAALAFRPGWVDVPAAGRADVEATVRCAPPWTGSPQRRDLVVAARGTNAAGPTGVGPTGVGPEEVTASASFTQRARLAPAAMRSARGLVTMVVGVATVLGAALLVKGQADSSSNDVQTAAEDTGAEDAGSDAASEAAASEAAASEAAASEAAASEAAASEAAASEDGTDDTGAGGSAGSTGSDDGTWTPAGAAVLLYETPDDATPIPAAPGADVSLPVDLFADSGIRSIAGKPDPDLVPPECLEATGLAGRDVDDPVLGYVQPALPTDPTLCHDVPLHVIFSPQPAQVEVYLPAVSAKALYSLEVTFSDEFERNVEQVEEHAPGEPDFTIDLAGTAAIASFTLARVEDGTDSTAPVALSWLRVSSRP